MENQYSVLMSVYVKERPEYLSAALLSILKQTLPPVEIIMVCDGPLTDGLNQVLNDFSQHITLVRLRRNCGLGVALAEGLKKCSCEWVARMDSDDIAANNRCEKQFRYVWQHPDVDVLSGVLAEFSGEALTEETAKESIISLKCLPLTNHEISEYIKYRNPINHPCVMFRKSKVLAAGNYQTCQFFEDYDLWMRMHRCKCVFANLNDIILYMRVNDVHKRRGGIQYAKAIICFWTKMYRDNMIALPQYLYTLIIRVIVSLLPNCIRKRLYDRKLRNQ